MITKTNASTLQKLIANNWLAKIWIGAFLIAALAIQIVQHTPSFRAFGFSWTSALLVIAMITMEVIVYLVSFIIGCMVLPPIYRWCERLNGAPFQEGNTIEILSKLHPGKTAIVTKSSAMDRMLAAKLIDSTANTEDLILPWNTVRKLD